MNVLAIYSVNQHLADLNEEARRNRLARQASPRPSAFRRAVAAIRSAIAARTTDTVTASAAS